MKRASSSGEYQIWPFRAEAVSPDGDRNNGGINLIERPELIDLIHEATEENGLRDLLISMNKPGKSFMTLGCLAGPDSGKYFSYIEFTPRSAVIARDEQVILNIYHQWSKWLASDTVGLPGLAAALQGSVVWEYRPFSSRGSDSQYLITFYCHANSARDHGVLTSWAHLFINKMHLADG